MSLSVTFRNLNPREEVRRRATALYAKASRFLDPSAEGQLVVAAEHGQICCDLVVTAKLGTFKASEEDEEIRTALDLVMHKLEEQLRRAKDRKHSPRRDAPTDEELVDAVVRAEVEADDDPETDV